MNPNLLLLTRLNIPTYCYHCGKKLDLLNKDFTAKKYFRYIHDKCLKQRWRLEYHLKKARYRMFLDNPVIKKQIEEQDDKIIKEYLKNHKPKINEVKVDGK